MTNKPRDLIELFEETADRITSGWYEDEDEDYDPDYVEPSKLTDKQAQAVLKNPKIKTEVGTYCIVSQISYGSKRLGQVMACLEDEDIKEDVRKFAKLKPIYHATDVELDPKLRGHGLGKRMYVECIKAIAANGGGSFGPHSVVNRKNTETTPDAMNVWHSLYRDYGKSGPFILIKPSGKPKRTK